MPEGSSFTSGRRTHRAGHKQKRSIEENGPLCDSPDCSHPAKVQGDLEKPETEEQLQPADIAILQNFEKIARLIKGTQDSLEKADFRVRILFSRQIGPEYG